MPLSDIVEAAAQGYMLGQQIRMGRSEQEHSNLANQLLSLQVQQQPQQFQGEQSLLSAQTGAQSTAQQQDKLAMALKMAEAWQKTQGSFGGPTLDELAQVLGPEMGPVFTAMANRVPRPEPAKAREPTSAISNYEYLRGQNDPNALERSFGGLPEPPTTLEELRTRAAATAAGGAEGRIETSDPELEAARVKLDNAARQLASAQGRVELDLILSNDPKEGQRAVAALQKVYDKVYDEYLDADEAAKVRVTRRGGTSNKSSTPTGTTLLDLVSQILGKHADTTPAGGGASDVRSYFR